ncbi:peptidase S8 subtilisin kexin sedolisin [Fusarium globosum]|uniref:Peptidase S8 subtilisin kexin sedolisin n=1 Tax=Fusarium globosum TaxID=78864 RepID=A0A8H5XWX0_9HYPO|nr:peptidase S8 subtilisin kexin sedolisin [Fusarium globosum]
MIKIVFSMEVLSQLELAQRAAQDAAVVAAKLQAKWRGSWFGRSPEMLKRLATMSTSLQCMSFEQDRYEQSEHVDTISDGVAKLEMFLCALEAVCTVRNFAHISFRQDSLLTEGLQYPDNNLAKTRGEENPSARFPTLSALVHAGLTQNNSSDTENQILLDIEKSIEIFASGTTKMTNVFFNLVRSFCDATKQAKNHAEAAQRDAQAQDGKSILAQLNEDESYPRHVYDTLYKALRKHAYCCCRSTPSLHSIPDNHLGRLELKESLPSLDDEVLFHTVFSKKALSESQGSLNWQHLQFRVSKKQPNRPKVQFTTEGQDLTASDGDIITTSSEFCDLLGRDIVLGSMDIRIKDEMLLVLKRAVDIEVPLANERSITLADVLRNCSLVAKSKLLLAYILAKSLWQLYDSDLMGVRWTTETIQLFRERGDDDEDEDVAGIHWAPYYTFSFAGPAEPDSVERLPLGQFLHRYPRVLALGAILYDLGWGRRGTTPAIRTSPAEPATLERIINDTTSRVRRGIRNGKRPDIGLRNIQALEDYRLVVANCLSENLFTPNRMPGVLKSPEELEEELTIEERRAILFRKVIVPLKKVVQATGWVDEFGNIRGNRVKSAMAQLKEQGCAPKNPILPSVALLNNTSPSDPPHGNEACGKQKSLGNEAEAWLARVKESPVARDVLFAFQKTDMAEKRIRIAVLDTGYDPGAIFFNRDRRRRLKSWKDFVELGQATPKDEEGHGTHVLSVLMQVAPAADIFVARVAKDTSELQHATETIAKAIEWAWRECDANIVNMSFGFDEEVYIEGKPIISNAILKAILETNQSIVFLAAAANSGGNKAEMFPAYNKNVLSIRGTDDYGTPQRFNPPPDYDSETCFMTLGLNVPGASLVRSEHQGADICKSGTSVATPIAAGLAAMLLGYARVHEEELQKILGPEDSPKLVRLWGQALSKKPGVDMY